MSVLDRDELQQSTLADLHAIASELGLEGYRRLRREELIEAILASAEGTPAGGEEYSAVEDVYEEAPIEEDTLEVELADEAALEPEPSPFEPEPDAVPEADALEPELPEEEAEELAVEPPVEDPMLDEATAATRPPRRGRSGRGRRRGRRARDEVDEPIEVPFGRPEEDEAGIEVSDQEPPAVEEDVRFGVLDILPNGSGFMRADAYVHSSDDVYVSPAQIRRCELRSGDAIAGPVRPPRRSERYPSLVRIEAVNDAPAEPPAERPLFEELTPVFASERLAAPGGLEGAPFGKGSRVAVGGSPGSGATTVLRWITAALAQRHPELETVVVLAGVRPEEVTDWRRELDVTIAGGGFDRPIEEQAQVADLAVERAKRVVERGGDAALVVDSLDALPPAAARRVFGAARNTEEAGSLTVIAATGTAGELQRVATTRVLLEPTPSGEVALSSLSGTVRSELLA